MQAEDDLFTTLREYSDVYNVQRKYMLAVHNVDVKQLLFLCRGLHLTARLERTNHKIRQVGNMC